MKRIGTSIVFRALSPKRRVSQRNTGYAWRVLRSCMACIFGIIAIAHAQWPTAETALTLRAEQDGRYPPAVYVVDSTITVQKDKTLYFEPGTTIYFKTFAGIEVYGTLICKGTADEPVRLTAHNPDSAWSSRKLNWNGIKLNGPDAALTLKHVHLQQSLVGVEVPFRENKVTLDSVLVEDNRFSDLSLQDSIVVADSARFVFFDTRTPVAGEANPQKTVSVRPAASDSSETNPQPKLQLPADKQTPRWVRSVQITALSLIAAGIGAYAGGEYYAREYQNMIDKPEKYSTSSQYGELAKFVAEKEEQFSTATTVRNVGLYLAGGASLGFILTLPF